jgi:membrane-bound serine protease (ClpP class)
MLFESPAPFLRVSLKLIIPATLATGGFFFFLVGKAVRAQRAQVSTGSEGLIGTEGTIREWTDGQGTVFVRGEIWKARSSSHLQAGQTVTVTSVEGLRLTVVPAEGES